MDLLTLADISLKLGVPEATLRYWAKLFDEFLPQVVRGGERFYQEEAVAAFKEINRMVEEGWPRNMIAEALGKMKLAGEEERAPEDLLQELLRRLAEAQLEAYKDRKALIGLLRHQQKYDRRQDERIDKLFEEIRRLAKLERMLDRHRAVEDKLKERTEAAKEEARQLKEELERLRSQNKRGFWSRLFGR